MKIINRIKLIEIQKDDQIVGIIKEEPKNYYINKNSLNFKICTILKNLKENEIYDIRIVYIIENIDNKEKKEFNKLMKNMKLEGYATTKDIKFFYTNYYFKKTNEKSEDILTEKSKLNLSANINTVELKCKNCGADVTQKYVPKELVYSYDKHLSKIDSYINHTVVSDKDKCPNCGSNTFNANIGIKIETK